MFSHKVDALLRLRSEIALADEMKCSVDSHLSRKVDGSSTCDLDDTGETWCSRQT
jgi:hypothetical protein